MARHWKAILAWSLLLATAFIGFLIAEKLALAFATMVAGLVTAYVVGIAWFHPRRRPYKPRPGEHVTES